MPRPIVRPEWTFTEMLANAFRAYSGTGLDSSGRRLNLIRQWAEMVGRGRATAELDHFVDERGGIDAAAEEMWIATSSLKKLRREFLAATEAPMVATMGPTLKAGETLAGAGTSYTVLEQVGSGGMGRVYSAERPDGTRVALKLLSSDRFEIGDIERGRFLREAGIARELDHPNLVRAFDVLEHRGLLVTVMELLPGENLHQRLAKGSPNRETGMRWMMELARGLGALHAKTIVHRDISARNTLFRVDDSLAISDFGVARRVDDPTLTTETTQFGSLIYISPQQREDAHAATFSDDVFSLGQLFFFIITGRNPHNLGALVRHKHEYGPRIEELVDLMRHHDRVQRPVDANDLAFRLEALNRERSVPSPFAASPTMSRLRAAVSASLSSEAQRVRTDEHRAEALRAAIRPIAMMVEHASIAAFREVLAAIADFATHVSLNEADLSSAPPPEVAAPRLASPICSYRFAGSNRTIFFFRAREGQDVLDPRVTAIVRELAGDRHLLYPIWLVRDTAGERERSTGLIVASASAQDALDEGFSIQLTGRSSDGNVVALDTPIAIKDYVIELLEQALASS